MTQKYALDYAAPVKVPIDETADEMLAAMVDYLHPLGHGNRYTRIFNVDDERFANVTVTFTVEVTR